MLLRTGCLRRWTAGVASLAFAGLALAITNATAADMPGEYLPPPVERRPVVIEQLGYGWYLRGDLGYRIGTLERAEAATGFPSPTDSHLGGAVTGSIGAGAKSRWLRTDLTVDYTAPQEYRGTVATPDDTKAKIRTIAALFNGYIDLGTWSTLTPYIGAGAGAAYVRAYDYSSTLAPPLTPVPPHNQWNFAWALMAGVGWQVAPNLMIDVGYRYLNVGDVRTESDAFGAMTFKNVGGHEVRAGLRWSFDDIRLAR